MSVASKSIIAEKIANHEMLYGHKPAFVVVSDEMLEYLKGTMDEKYIYGIHVGIYNKYSDREKEAARICYEKSNKMVEETPIQHGYKGQWLIFQGVFLTPRSECVVYK